VRSDPGWTEREQDEPVTDWLLRLQISYAAVTGLVRVQPRETAGAA
jgi:hypothetical protein